jgi:L-ribulose-5-phosphate 4-epimerase
VLDPLREEVLEANLELVRQGLVLYTFGNASGIDRGRGLVAIKPSGVPYRTMQPSDLVIVDLEGRVVEGTLRPSSDLPTHLVLYRRFAQLGGVVHTHSAAACAWAEAGRAIPCLGTTHADHFHGPVPVTRALGARDVGRDYEAATGRVIARAIGRRDPMTVPAVLVAGHGPFCWGRSAGEAAHNAVVLEHVARVALDARALNPQARALPSALLDKHFLRKHGAQAYYGQARTSEPAPKRARYSSGVMPRSRRKTWPKWL